MADKRKKADRFLDYAERAMDWLADRPLPKAIGAVISNPTPQEFGAQVANLGASTSKSLQDFSNRVASDPVEAGSLVGPVGMAGTIYKGFHQTSKAAEEAIRKEGFDLGKRGAAARDIELPFGVFYKSTNKNIGLGATKESEVAQIPVSSDIKNPIFVKDRREFNNFISQKYPDINDLQKKEIARQKLEMDKFESISREFKELSKKKNISREEWRAKIDKQQEILDNNDAEGLLAAENIRAKITEYLTRDGYDGIIINKDLGSFGRETDTIIALTPNSVKVSAEDFLSK